MLRLKVRKDNQELLLQHPPDMNFKRLFRLNAITALILGGLSISAHAPTSKPEELKTPEPAAVEISIESLANELQRQGLVHWRVVLAQAVVETGWEFNSSVFKNANNFIGMRVPNSRPSTRAGVYKGYSAYATWQDCVADVKLWQGHCWKGGTRDEYIEKLGRTWAEAPNYEAHLHKLVVQFEEQFPS